jgi:hypothetical protein
MSTRFVFAALVSAILLSSCSSPPDTGPARAQSRIVSKEVGPLLIEAKALGDAGNYQGSLAKLNEAEAVKALPDDTTVISDMRHYMEFKMASSHPSQP